MLVHAAAQPNKGCSFCLASRRSRVVAVLLFLPGPAEAVQLDLQVVDGFHQASNGTPQRSASVKSVRAYLCKKRFTEQG